MYSMSATLEVFQPDSSRVLRDLQSPNAYVISSTLLVSQLERSPTVVRLGQLKNKKLIFVTLLVSQLERSPTVVRDSQYLNMVAISSTLLISSFDRSTDVREEQPLNQSEVETGAIPSSTT